MKDRWEALSLKIDALTVRERGIILVTLLVILYMFFLLIAFDPLIAERSRLTNMERDIKSKTQKLRVEIAEVIAESKFDPN